MRAAFYEEYGPPDVLQTREIDPPVVARGDVLVRVRACGVNPLDWHMLTGIPYITRLQAGLARPKRNVPGVDIAGIVEAVGEDVTEFQPGDEVFGESLTGGGFAELVALPEEGLVTKPTRSSFEEAAAVPVAGETALQGLRDKGRLEPGDEVLIIGASGGVGTVAVQIARALGSNITAVCSTRNVDMVRSIGAERVIDYTEGDFTRDRTIYDVVFDVIGDRGVTACRRLLGPDGTYVMVGGPKGRWLGPIPRLLRVLAASAVGRQRMVGLLAKRNRADLRGLARLLESGALVPVIDRRYELSEAADALRAQQEGHAQGKSVIVMDG